MMRYAWAALRLGLSAVGVAVGVAVGSAAQAAWGQAPTSQPSVELRQNYPNPFNPATTMPFRLSGVVFANGHRPKVSLKIYNVLAQLVAVPILQGTGEPMDDLELSCSNPEGCSFSCYWDGNVLNTGKPAASGVYLYQLIVDGKRYTRKMIIMK